MVLFLRYSNCITAQFQENLRRGGVYPRPNINERLWAGINPAPTKGIR